MYGLTQYLTYLVLHQHEVLLQFYQQQHHQWLYQDKLLDLLILILVVDLELTQLVQLQYLEYLMD